MQELPNGRFSVNYGRIGKLNESAEDLARLEAEAEAKGIRNIYRDENLQADAWEHAQTFPAEILDGLTGETVDGKKANLQNIESMMNNVDDYGNYTLPEWTLFFQILREEGI